MCHLVLLLPVIGLTVFWVLPLTTALIVYMVVFALSVWLYWYVVKSVFWPVQTGVEKMRRSVATVIAVDGSRLTVSMNGEIWTAVSRDRLEVNDRAEVLDIEGLVLKVKRMQEASAAADGGGGHVGLWS